MTNAPVLVPSVPPQSPRAAGVGPAVLVVDDEASMCEAIAAELSGGGYRVAWRTSADEAFTLVEGGDYEVVITDLNMRGMNGLELCGRIVDNRPDVPVIVITAFGSLETAIATIRAGAFDFVTKPFEAGSLLIALERAIQGRTLRQEVKRLREAVASEPKTPGGIVGASPAMVSVYGMLERITHSDVTVLITGESGTGKELAARALHRQGRRKDGPFVAVNCAALPEHLLESELFGHLKGAFTDAKVARRGLFLEAHKGTLFLDEIGEMPLAMQTKLLRALQERTVRPVGGDEERAFDVRLVAATNRDLQSAVEDKAFREDLYYRINIVELALPPLRARGGDVLLLAQHFLAEHARREGAAVKGLSTAAADRLLAYTWPGNVRELQNCIERAVALARFEEVTVEDLPEHIRNYRPHHVLVASDDPSDLVSLDEVAQRYVVRVFQAVGGNKTAAAKVLGVDRKTLYRRLVRAGMVPAGDTQDEG